MAIGQIDPGRVKTTTIPVLLEVASKKPSSVATVAALKCLAQLGPDSAPAVPTMIDLLRDSQLGIRSLAAEVLGSIGPAAKEAVPALQELEKANIEGPSQAATGALRRIQAK